MKKNSCIGTGDLFEGFHGNSNQKKTQAWTKAETHDWILEKTNRKSTSELDFLKLITGSGLSKYQKRFLKKI